MKRQIAALLCAWLLLAAGLCPNVQAQSTTQTTWPNNGNGLQNLSGGLPVSNGQWVNAGEVIWTQITSQAAGNISVTTVTRMLVPTSTGNALSISSNTVNPCSLATNGGFGFGYVAPTQGWLQSVGTQVNTAGFPQGAFYIQHFIMPAMPSGGTSTTCTASFTAFSQTSTAPLDCAPTGSFFSVGFVGTTAICNSPWSIPGFTTTQAITNPAAGAEWSFAFPSGAANGARSCVQAVFFQLAASATVANRVVGLRLLFGSSTPQIYYISPTAQTASQTVQYSFAPGTSATNYAPTATIIQTVPFNNGQPLCFNSGLSSPSIGTLTSGLQVGDQFSFISILLNVQNDND